jgi:hypothetical protein
MLRHLIPPYRQGRRSGLLSVAVGAVNTTCTSLQASGVGTTLVERELPPQAAFGHNTTPESTRLRFLLERRDRASSRETPMSRSGVYQDLNLLRSN